MQSQMDHGFMERAHGGGGASTMPGSQLCVHCCTSTATFLLYRSVPLIPSWKPQEGAKEGICKDHKALDTHGGVGTYLIWETLGWGKGEEDSHCDITGRKRGYKGDGREGSGLVSCCRRSERAVVYKRVVTPKIWLWHNGCVLPCWQQIVNSFLECFELGLLDLVIALKDIEKKKWNSISGDCISLATSCGVGG